MPSRSVRRDAQAVVGDLPFGGEAGLDALAVVGRQEQRVVEVGQDPDVDVGVVEHRIEKEAVGIAPVGHDAAALHGEGGEAGTDEQVPRARAALASIFIRGSPLSPVNYLSVLIGYNDFTYLRRCQRYYNLQSRALSKNSLWPCD